jgi:hypothetical protein
MKCPKCGFDNIDKAKFCNECGHNLTQPFSAPPKELSFDEKIAKIQKYLPSDETVSDIFMNIKEVITQLSHTVNIVYLSVL